MKKYFVARLYNSESVLPSIVFSTDIEEDAKNYAGIVSRSDGNTYKVLAVDE